MTEQAQAGAGQVDIKVNAPPPAAGNDGGKPADPKATPQLTNGKAAADPVGADRGADSGPDPASQVASDWPDDWRDRFIKKAPATERESLQKRLNRFTSPDNVLTSYIELDRKLRAGQLQPVLADGASEEEVKAYRKAAGVPDEATPEAYGVEWPKEFEATEADQADLKDFVGVLHAKNVPPAVAQDLWKFYQGIREKADGQAREFANARSIEQQAEIRAEFGPDFEKNLRYGKAFIDKHLGGAERREALVSLTLADGTKLGNHPEFVRLFTAAARSQLDDREMATAEVDNGQSIDDAYNAMLDVRYKDPKKYNSPEFQEKLMRYAAAKTKKSAA